METVMDLDATSLKRIKMFATFLQQAKEAGTKPSFFTTPTENGDNITAVATLNGEKRNVGILFWDINALQERGLVDILDDDDLALGMNITDSMIEDVEQILSFANTELKNFEA
jgi:hypothetical protein